MKKDKSLYIWVMLADLILLCIVATAVFFIYQLVSPASITPLGDFMPTLVIMIVSFIIAFSLYPSLSQNRIVSPEDVVKRVASTSCIFALSLTILIVFLHPSDHFPRHFLVIFILTFAVALTLERLAIRKFFMSARAKKRNANIVVLVGNNDSILKIYKLFSKPVYGYNIVASFYDGDNAPEEIAAIRKGGVIDLFTWLTSKNYIDEIYVSLSDTETDKINVLSKYCDNHLIRLYYVPSLNVFNGNVAMTSAGNIPIVARRREPLTIPVNRFIKRAFDFIMSSIFLVLVYPWILLVVSIIIKCKSPGPIYFRQERTGLDGKVFTCLKFRSMKVNNDSDTVQATKDDPRKYPFGDFMRKTNIDELPQLINVWKGEMSLVGPRPHMLKHTEEYSQLVNRFMVRHLAKPGITGLAQVSGFRGETKYLEQMEGRVRKDIEYIENWTFLLDLKIIFKTLINMIGGEKNAY